MKVIIEGRAELDTSDDAIGDSPNISSFSSVSSNLNDDYVPLNQELDQRLSLNEINGKTKGTRTPAYLP